MYTICISIICLLLSNRLALILKLFRLAFRLSDLLSTTAGSDMKPVTVGNVWCAVQNKRILTRFYSSRVFVQFMLLISVGSRYQEPRRCVSRKSERMPHWRTIWRFTLNSSQINSSWLNSSRINSSHVKLFAGTFFAVSSIKFVLNSDEISKIGF